MPSGTFGRTMRTATWPPRVGIMNDCSAMAWYLFVVTGFSGGGLCRLVAACAVVAQADAAAVAASESTAPTATRRTRRRSGERLMPWRRSGERRPWSIGMFGLAGRIRIPPLADVCVAGIPTWGPEYAG